MFCTACGTQIAIDQAVCTKCGTPTSIGIMQGGGRRVAEHYRLLGILMIVYSGLVTVTGFAILLVSRVIVAHIFELPHNGPPPPAFVIGIIGPIMSCIGWFALAKGVAGIVAGSGLLSRAPWARTLAVVVGFLSLLSIPIGTALGIYTIWVLLSQGAEREYDQLALAH
jgi:hypothetical protein